MMLRWILAGLALGAWMASAQAAVWYDGSGNGINTSGMYFQNGAGVGTPVSPAAPLPTGPGTLTYTVSTSGSAGTTSGTLITAGQFSKIVKICTLFSSTTNVWLNLAGGTAAVNAGIGIPAGGGCRSLGAPDTPMPTGAITAITDGGSAQTVTITGG